MDQMDCGPACLAMIASFYHKDFSLEYVRDQCFLTKSGVSLQGISDGAETLGFKRYAVKLDSTKLFELRKRLPAIIHWDQNHFVVLYKIKKSLFDGKLKYKISDPSYGFISLSNYKFERHWLSDNSKGIALFLDPTEQLYSRQVSLDSRRYSIRDLFSYLRPYKLSLWLMFVLLLVGSLISLAFPFLTQNLIDKGVNAKDLNVITIILLAQLIGTHINLQIISDFLKKLLKLPIKFFDTKLMGDFNQRIADHERIENFLTSQSLITFFSMLTFSVFFAVLWYYNIQILLIYLGLTIIAIFWSLFWLKRRKILDYFRFQQRSENQQSIYEMINGVTEMKMNQFEDYKVNEWQEIQHKLFKTNIRILRLNQVQLSGFEFLNQLKNILVTFLAASFVIKGSMTLGALLSVSYIIGQMNSPINQLMNFFRSLQDAKLSLSRLNEVQNHPEEDSSDTNDNREFNLVDAGFDLKNLDFQYEGPHSRFVLKGINLSIPHGKITAIVGSSGSGKTTLMKLLLKFYEPINGCIFLGDTHLSEISHLWLRQKSGVVMQDGFIFGDTIERNIACGDEHIDHEKLDKALWIANLEEFTNSLPLGLHTKIGASGNGISGGQKQRILIARAVYKNPEFLFFDEATSALDAENEKIIHNRLQSFFRGKTVLIIAHRLSTVKNADQIIVLKNGQIVETGVHQELVSHKASYYHLVKNQLELGT